MAKTPSTTPSDFRRDLGAAPTVRGPSQASAVTSARQHGAASVQAQGQILQSNVDLFNVGVEAVKGTAVRSAADKINWYLERQEDVGAEALASQDEIMDLTSTGAAIGQAAQLMEQGGAFPGIPGSPEPGDDPARQAAVEAQLEDIAKQKLKLSQGIFTRQQVLTNIAKIVKSYSQAAPGWSQDFRVAAANATGISNIDVYGVHASLTQASAREKQFAADAKAQGRYIEDVATHAGVPPGSVTPQHQQQYAIDQQMKAELDRMKFNEEIAAADQVQQDQAGDTWMALHSAGSIMNMSKALTAVITAGTESGTADAFEAFQGQSALFLNDLQKTKAGLDAQLNSLRAPSADRKWTISQEKHAALQKDLNSSFAQLKSYFDDAHKFNAFASMVEASQGNMELLMNGMRADHPQIMLLNETGASEKIFDQYIAMMSQGRDVGQAQFTKQFGPGMFKAVDGFMTQDFAAGRYKQNQDRVKSNFADPANADAASDAIIDPDATRVDVASYDETWRAYMATPAARRNPGDALKIWRTLPTLLGLNPADDNRRNALFMSPKERAKIVEPLNSGAFKAAYEQLSDEDKANADIIVAKTNRNLRGHFRSQINDIVMQTGRDPRAGVLTWDENSQQFHLRGADPSFLQGGGENYADLLKQANDLVRVTEHLQEINPERGEVLTRKEMFQDITESLNDQLVDNLEDLPALTQKLENAKLVAEIAQDEFDAVNPTVAGRSASSPAAKFADPKRDKEQTRVSKQKARADATLGMIQARHDEATTDIKSIQTSLRRWGSASPKKIKPAVDDGLVQEKDFPKISPEVQRKRDIKALGLLREELNDPAIDQDLTQVQIDNLVERLGGPTTSVARRKDIAGEELPAPKNNQQVVPGKGTVAQTQSRVSTGTIKNVVDDAPGFVVAEIRAMDQPAAEKVKMLNSQIDIAQAMLDKTDPHAGKFDALKWRNYIEVLTIERKRYQDEHDL